MNPKYNRAEAIDNATQLFWQKGYQATKMRDIQAALNMRPGSIYAGFGNKFGLFSAVVDNYVAGSIGKLQATTERQSQLSGLREFFRFALQESEQQSYQRQCLLVRCLVEVEGSDTRASNLIRKGLSNMEDAFAAILQTAVSQGELPDDYPVEYGGKWLQQQLMGLRSYSVANSAGFDADTAIEQVFNFLPRLVK